MADQEEVTLKVAIYGTTTPVYIKVPKAADMGKLKDFFCGYAEIDRQVASFWFNYVPINDSDTVISLGMVDGDIILVFKLGAQNGLPE